MKETGNWGRLRPGRPCRKEERWKPRNELQVTRRERWRSESMFGTSFYLYVIVSLDS